MLSTTPHLLILGSFLRYVYSTGINDQFNPGFDYGTFANPSSNVRPRFRYWVPDASINLTHLAFDIADAGSRGVGGVEILGYYLYGGMLHSQMHWLCLCLQMLAMVDPKLHPFRQTGLSMDGELRHGVNLLMLAALPRC